MPKAPGSLMTIHLDEVAPPPETTPIDRMEHGDLGAVVDSFTAELMKLMGPVAKEEWQKTFFTQPMNVVDFGEKMLRQKLWPEQEKALVAIFGVDEARWKSNGWEEVDLFWGKGSGKSDGIAYAFDFGAYFLKNLRDPQAFFSKQAGDPIDLINVSFNARQAKNVFFRKLKAKMRKTIDPLTGENWFEQRGMDLSEGGKFVQSRLVYLDEARTLAIHAGDSVEYTGEGLNLLLALFDEIGAMGQPDKALALHGALKDTVKTRFGPNGCTVAISYQYSTADAMTFLVAEATKPMNKDRCYVSHKATFEVNPTVTKESLAGEYARNPERALRVFECRGRAVGANAFFKYREEIRGRANAKRRSPLVGEAWWTNDLDNCLFESWFRGAPQVEYHIHIDLATGGERKDKIGLTMGRSFTRRASYSEDYVKALLVDGKPAPPLPTNEEKAVWYELMLQVRAKTEEGEVRFQSIIDFVVRRLKNELGFNVTLVTYDGWQSAGEIQRLKEAGIPAVNLSVDKTSGPAETLKGLIYSGLADYYAHPVFMREAEELMEEAGKVDHPKLSTLRAAEEDDNRGSKDVWDSAAAVAESFINPVYAGKGYRLGF